MFPIKTLLHPTDFSEYAEEGHAVACALAREQNARLVILHVTDKPVVSYLEKASELNPQQVQDKLWETLQWPREMEAGLNIEHRIEEGDAVGQIVRVATEIGSDLIVMGSHGKRGWFSWFTSNVVENVIRKAPCSVLVAKPSKPETGKA
jgi:nucleotide-binding universal stress UspA family protein